jgi:hypothetical protein
MKIEKIVFWCLHECVQREGETRALRSYGVCSQTAAYVSLQIRSSTACKSSTTASIKLPLQLKDHSPKWRTGTQPIPRSQSHLFRYDGTDLLTPFPQSSWSIIIGLVVVVLTSLAAWFFAPKGENQTYAKPLLQHPLL